MKFRDWVGMLFFFPGVLLQLAAMRICGPHGRKLINEAVSDAAHEIFTVEKP